MRLGKLETKLPAPQTPRRVITIAAGANEREAAISLARAHGFDPDDNDSSDLLILRSIVNPNGKPYLKAPYVVHR
jgi:hypothetical protein